MSPLSRKKAGAYYTPASVAQTLLQWALRSDGDRLIDPSCGDGQFISGHRNSVGIEQDAAAAKQAIERAPGALVHEGDFFSWALNTTERFDCAAGNPPFIRYQSFNGEARAASLKLCAKAGVKFSGLASSWAPFLVGAATLLQPGGRMAFVVPAEIGHAPYASPLIEYLASRFGLLHVVAVRRKLFPDLSEDCWLLYADGFGQRTGEIRFTAMQSFRPSQKPPQKFLRVPLDAWRTTWRGRLRAFLLTQEARDFYQEIMASPDTRRFGDLATIGIGYVSGANDFFHLRPSEAAQLRIPKTLLHPTVRNGRALSNGRLTRSDVARWYRNDEQILLLKLPKSGSIPELVARYLDSEAGQRARKAYKCRVREPWYSVPDVQVPDFFLSYMSGVQANLVRNEAECTCTNSVHSVRLRKDADASKLLRVWDSPFVKLSTELEGHPLGGGMLKLEPREATRIALPSPSALKHLRNFVVDEALMTMRQWRHHVPAQ